MGDLIECPDGLDEKELHKLPLGRLTDLFNGMVKEYHKQYDIANRIIPPQSRDISDTAAQISIRKHRARRGLLQPLRYKINYIGRLLHRRLIHEAIEVRETNESIS